MTNRDFERRVAGALVAALLRDGDYAPETRAKMEAGVLCPPIVDDLAPRVAAAIDAAALAAGEDSAFRRDRAIAALRGDP